MPLTHGTELLRATARAAFWQNFEDQPDIMANVVFRVTSDSDQETYPYTSAAPSPREMSGSRAHKAVPEISYSIKNKKWESTVDISYEMWRFNRLAQVSSLTSELGMKARNYPSNLLASLMSTGDAATGPDGQLFFSAAHLDAGAEYTSTQDNDIGTTVVSTTVPTDVEWASAIRSSINTFHGFKDGQGDPVVPRPGTVFEVHVPADYLTVAERVATVSTLTGPVANDMQGRYTVVHNPWLDAAGTTPEFFIFNTMGARKPFILQEAEAVSMEDNLGTEMEKETKDRWVGSFGYYNVGYGDWRYAIRHLLSV